MEDMGQRGNSSEAVCKNDEKLEGDRLNAH